ncbi:MULTISPECIES: PadR family transcriptional regulator [Microbacterium]|uniref:PadR family transcriptional regulator n=1 Tax=Microbacterium TaxID=33882 RepID=UPI00217D256C|nr:MULTISPECIES: PadR family transcriptional regulator [Microbacterium]UWF77450.1 PadR family transcriptional regulator [Microbacterium neungamense]WCM55613.1 PadR family transcriptional regulator [Microbacterium sp. EF45047]
MTATRLLILGAVRQRGSAHGYQVRRDLESWAVHRWGSVERGSIYHGLRKLRDEGLLAEVAPSAPAAGPAKTEYALTPAGEKAFLQLLERALGGADDDFSATMAGIGFMPALARSRVIELLTERLAAHERQRAQIADELARHQGEDWEHHIEAVKLWAHTVDSAARWVRELIARLESGAYRMAGEA